MQSNDIADKETLTHLLRGLLENEEGSALMELDLSKNRISSESIQPFVTLFEQN